MTQWSCSAWRFALRARRDWSKSLSVVFLKASTPERWKDEWACRVVAGEGPSLENAVVANRVRVAQDGSDLLQFEIKPSKASLSLGRVYVAVPAAKEALFQVLEVPLE